MAFSFSKKSVFQRKRNKSVFWNTKKLEKKFAVFQRKAKKKVESWYIHWKNLIIDKKIGNFFQFRVSVFFLQPNLSGVRNTILLRKHVYSNISFGESHNEGIPKSAISTDFFTNCFLCIMVFLYIGNYFSQKYKAQPFHSRLNRKLFINIGFWKIGGFLPCVTILIDGKFKNVSRLLIYFDTQTHRSKLLRVGFLPPVSFSKNSRL